MKFCQKYKVVLVLSHLWSYAKFMKTGLPNPGLCQRGLPSPSVRKPCYQIWVCVNRVYRLRVYENRVTKSDFVSIGFIDFGYMKTDLPNPTLCQPGLSTPGI
jgi:hypothetical protein